MWTISKTYTFVPSGDANELHIKIVERAPLDEAIAWYENIYSRPFDLDASTAYRAVVVKGGYDADLRHKRGDVYYLFNDDFGPSHSQPEGPQVVL